MGAFLAGLRPDKIPIRVFLRGGLGQITFPLACSYLGLMPNNIPISMFLGGLRPDKIPTSVFLGWAKGQIKFPPISWFLWGA